MSNKEFNYFETMSDWELVNSFNRETNNQAFVSAKARYMAALKEAFEQRDISLEHLVEKTTEGYSTLSLQKSVYLQEQGDKKVLIPIVPKGGRIIILNEE